MQRDLVELATSLVKYHRQVFTLKSLIYLHYSEPQFLNNIKKHHDLLHQDIEDPRYFHFYLEDWNHFTNQTYHALLDFLEFPKENRLEVIPVKFSPEQRDFDAYSDSHLDKEHVMCKQIEVIRKHG